ncbi:putative anti-sigma-YlaC factor YlaD [Treponema putidum]|nr:putative anti-sigma-YlaC factor YlaD [Treponema putidum]
MKKLQKNNGFIMFIGLFFTLTLLGFSSCSIKKMAYNSAANAMAPLPEKKIKPDPDAPNPITALTEEDDIELVGEVFPVILKLYEGMHIANPAHRGLAIMTGELYIMYANVFVEGPANYLSDDEYDKKDEAFNRAKKFYKRGYNKILSALDIAYPGFTEAINSDNTEKIEAMLKNCKPYDTEALHWAGAGILAAFSLDPLDIQSLQAVQGARLMLEKVCSLDPDYSEGAVWEILAKFYASAPDSLGGNIEKAEIAYKNALELAGGKSPSIYVTYALSFCVPRQDGKGFDEAIEKALAINPESDPANKLANKPTNKLAISISQRYAKWLKENKEMFILGDME